MSFNPNRTCFRRACGWFFIWILAGAGRMLAQESGSEVLTNAADILALPAEQALKPHNVWVKGVVTGAEKYWDGRFFVQDGSAGIFVDNVSPYQPKPGDVIEVAGVSHPGAFAPVISRPTWKKVGTAPLPAAKPVTIEALMSGIEDSQRVEITGVLRAIGIEHSLLSIDLVSGGYRFHVFAQKPTGLELNSLVGATVRVRGTAAATFNAHLRQLITMKVFVPRLEDFIVETPETVNPFDQPVLPLNRVAQYGQDRAPGKRVHVKGIVTHQRVGEDLFLQDQTAGLHLTSHQLTRFAIGDVIEAAGFADFENFLPVLQDAVFRKTREQPLVLEPNPVTIEEVQRGFHHASFVSLRGKLLDRAMRHVGNRGTNLAQIKTVLTLQGGNSIFTAESESATEPVGLLSIPIGSTIEVRGVTLAESNEDGKIKALQILLPDVHSFQILKRPSRLTPQRLLVGLGVLAAVLLVAVSWTVMVSKRNAALKNSIGEKEVAQRELQHAHDELEERVKERTAQLKFQITARKESELQFKAVLNERTRLAQELHDTLEQTLTGIALQLNTTVKLAQSRPERANHHLELARNLVTQSQVEIRRSIWDLRSRALEKFDLPGALLTSGRQLTDGTNIQLEVEAVGRVRPLPETLEENLLRIAQEALTNVIKHSEATLARIDLDFGPQNIVLQVKDNGRGFAPENCGGPREGHFGLLGISERAKRLQARFVVESAPGAGTTLRVEIPLDGVPERESSFAAVQL